MLDMLRKHTSHRLGAAVIFLAPFWLGAKGCEAEAGGTECGGPESIACEEGEYCAFDEAACGTAGEPVGKCERKPDRCNDRANPVCGCDGVTYSNSCSASQSGISVMSSGPCPSGPVSADADECGGPLGEACEAGYFCSFPMEAKCGAAGETGKCQLLPDRCNDRANPVCGCDGVTYSNSCSASQSAISVAAAGACETR